MSLAETWTYYWDNSADPRTKEWIFTSSPWPISLITVAYLYIVVSLGPRYMLDRKPYDLRTFAKYYNVFQIISNAWVIYSFVAAGWFTEFSMYCEPFDYSYRETSYKVAKIVWWVQFIKVSDYIETIVFVLRKKDRQVSFLHLYHHASTAVLMFYTARYIASGMSGIVIMLNCSVHVIMYTYYYLTTFGKKMQRILMPVKPFLTAVQMGQLLFLAIYLGQCMTSSCPATKFHTFLNSGNMLVNLGLFYNFYRKNYTKTKSKVQ